MNNQTILKNKAEFKTTAETFLDKMFKPALENNLGDIEIRTFPNGQWPEQYFCQTAKEATDIAFDLCNSGIDVYFGVNSRTGKRGKKENVHYVAAFHAEIDYGTDGHKKPTDYQNYDDAIKAITKFKPQPTLINNSGGGLHCYWVLKTPVNKDEIGVKELESINKYFLKQLGGDKGTHNLDRVLRIPGTYNFKLPDNPRQVRVIHKDGPVYDFDDFRPFINIEEPKRKDTNDRKKYQLKIVPFQEYMNKKHRLKFLEKERTFFRYNEKCYEHCSEDRLNYLCQTELGKHRGLFPPASKANFIHFAIGNDMVDDDKAYENQIRYLTLQNGLYDLSQHELTEHSPDIFTTNLLPYDYDPAAVCPRWIQYLDEVFESDDETIKFVQEAVGYAFHKSIPKAVLFFLIGDGGNGKSVFIDVISALCGKENVCNISLNKLNDEKYLPELFGKMINVSGETPTKKCMNTDLVKSVVAGDWVTGREVYKKPSKFKPYAKHYLGMNTLPDIEDNTHGMWRRLHVIEFPRKFAEHEMDVELTEKLMAELSGIFNWALEGYKRLGGQKFIFSESPTMSRSKKQYQQQSNSVLDFIDRCLKDGTSEESAAFKDLYDCYSGFCATEGNKKCFPKKEFRAILENEGIEVANSSKHSNQLRVFGVKYEVVYE